ncbi:MAG: AAA family ATPase [Haliscomenobacter sp.]|uniref:AAA family ATPase n=1 Tax=Haliscomenobacter sp. TaxID=2717303 RepID=UPI0029A729CB|nr:AAA family ATPase [Haliscomenobacter sp.]MDX2068575.1 AAA family ATPase [Haliscomenobacter sp.]
MIKHIKASNILSFGPDGLDLELRPLNVLIGANGSGKSNFLELIDLMRSTVSDTNAIFTRGGGVNEWIWKGASDNTANLALTISEEDGEEIRHCLKFTSNEHRFMILGEKIDSPVSETNYYEYAEEKYTINGEEPYSKKILQSNKSVLVQYLPHSEIYPQFEYLENTYKNIGIYKNWTFGQNAAIRKPQPADLRTDKLESDFTNLGLVLSRIRREPKVKKNLIYQLQHFYQGVTDYDIAIEGGYVQIFFFEGDYTIPASRLSDGTLRYLCLLAILLDPKPPVMICLEEPELGLHPDILPQLTDLLIEASERTQLVITTHSDVIVDALTDHPDSILVCEKYEGQTSIHRLESDKIKPWLEDYRLGDLWSKGQIGGNRW